VVVDNASADGTVALAATLGERVAVIEAGANAGFAAACRLGVEATRAPLLCLLNPTRCSRRARWSDCAPSAPNIPTGRRGSRS